MIPLQQALLFDDEASQRDHFTVTPLVRPPRVPADLWMMLTDSERAEIALEDGGYIGLIGSGPWRCHYFTTWDRDGKAIATYDKTESGWVKQQWPNPSHHDGAASAPSVDGVVGSLNQEKT